MANNPNYPDALNSEDIVSFHTIGSMYAGDNVLVYDKDDRQYKINCIEIFKSLSVKNPVFEVIKKVKHHYLYIMPKTHHLYKQYKRR